MRREGIRTQETGRIEHRGRERKEVGGSYNSTGTEREVLKRVVTRAQEQARKSHSAGSQVPLTMTRPEAHKPATNTPSRTVNTSTILHTEKNTNTIKVVGYDPTQNQTLML